MRSIGSEWRKHSVACRAKLNMPTEGSPGGAPWTSRKPCDQVPHTRRILDVIDVCYHEFRGKICDLRELHRKHSMPPPEFSDSSSEPDLYVRHPQGVNRCHGTLDLGTLCKSGLPFNYKLKANLTAESLFVIHGYPQVSMGSKRSKLSPAEVRGLLGGVATSAI